MRGTLTCGLCLLTILPDGGDAWHLLTADEARDLALHALAGAPVHADCLAQEYDALEQVTGEMERLARDLSARSGGRAVSWRISSVSPDPTRGGSALLVVREGEAKA